LLAPARRPRKSAHIGIYRLKSIYGFCPLTRQSDALPAPKSIDQNQGPLIWRADLAENKEAKFYRHGGSGGAEGAAKAEFFGFRR
jgi:hypothetical protein